MPDWHRNVARQLAHAKLSAEEREEISRELGDYLEDLCGDARRDGVDDRSATQRALAELHQDKNLGAHLFRARRERPMHLNDRTRQLWLPVMAMLFTSAALLATFQIGASWAFDGYGPTQPARNLSGLTAHLMKDRAVAFVVYLAWLYTLPFLAAAGAYWSRRAGGRLATQISTGLSSLLLFAALFVGQHAVAHQGTSLSFLAIGALPPAYMFFPFWTARTNLLCTWIVIPGAALLLGVLPFCCQSFVRRHDPAASAGVA